MAYASHTNTDVHAQLRAGQIPTPCPFSSASSRRRRAPPSSTPKRRWHCDDFAPSFPHIIYVDAATAATRARASRGCWGRVAYVVVDETDHGPVIEKWDILACTASTSTGLGEGQSSMAFLGFFILMLIILDACECK